MTILHDIKFLKIYDKALFDNIISYLEYFLKLHFKLLIKKYDFEIYYPILVDIRFEILNLLKTSFLNLPNISRIVYIQNIDEYMEKRIKAIQGITYKLMKLLCLKFNKPFKPPYEYDKMKNKHYSMF